MNPGMIVDLYDSEQLDEDGDPVLDEAGQKVRAQALVTGTFIDGHELVIVAALHSPAKLGIRECVPGTVVILRRDERLIVDTYRLTPATPEQIAAMQAEKRGLTLATGEGPNRHARRHP